MEKDENTGNSGAIWIRVDLFETAAEQATFQ
jgi:hypothetical protein